MSQLHSQEVAGQYSLQYSCSKRAQQKTRLQDGADLLRSDHSIMTCGRGDSYDCASESPAAVPYLGSRYVFLVHVDFGFEVLL